MSYYVHTLVERTANYDVYLSRPNFIPRKVLEDKSSPDLTGGTTASGKTEGSSDSDLSLKQKESLRQRLNEGRGHFSPQEWDDLLADMVDYGLISNTDRMYANGILKDVPEAALGGTHISFSDSSDLFSDSWSGDPLKWLDQMSFNLFKKGLYAEMDQKSASGIYNQKAALDKVSMLLKDIAYSGKTNF